MCRHSPVYVREKLDVACVYMFSMLHQPVGLTLHLSSTVGPQGAAGRVQKAQVEARGGSVRSHVDWGWRGRSGIPYSRRAAGRGAPGRGTGSPATQDAPWDPYADPGGPQQTAGVPAAQAQGASATGTLWEAWWWGAMSSGENIFTKTLYLSHLQLCSGREYFLHLFDSSSH